MTCTPAAGCTGLVGILWAPPGSFSSTLRCASANASASKALPRLCSRCRRTKASGHPMRSQADTRRIVPPPTAHERGLAKDKKLQARRELESAARDTRAVVDKALLDDLRKVHPEVIARRIVAQRHEQNLLPDIVLDFDHLSLVRVGDVLADPARFEGETLCDPFAGENYGRCKAQIVRSRSGNLTIHSFAHGGIMYRLRHDLASALTTLGKATKATALDLMCEVDAAASFEADEAGQLIAEAVRISGVGIRIVAKRLQDARKVRDRARRKARAEAKAAADTSNRQRRLMVGAPRWSRRSTRCCRLTAANIHRCGTAIAAWSK
jgi:hypothetical protein